MTPEEMDPRIVRLTRARALIRKGEARVVGDVDLIGLAAGITDAPARPSDCRDWAEDEAVPLIHELGRRFAAARRWYATPPESEEITATGLETIGFRRDLEHGHTIYVRRATDEQPGCHTSVHLLPDADGWLAEIHNWQTGADGERACEVDQRVGLPRKLRTYHEVRRLCAAVSEHWEEATS